MRLSHHRLVHEDGFGVRATDDGLFVFSRPDGERIAVAGEAVRRFCGNVAGVIEQDIEIDAETIRSRWQGEPLDYGLAIEALWRSGVSAHDT